MRAHNFSAGPSGIPQAVLERAREEFIDFRGAGMSIMEMSHRTPTYEAVHDGAIANLRHLLKLGDDYAVIFMGGGARSQFALVPSNLAVKGKRAKYLVTGSWSTGALKEAKKLTDADAVWSSEATNFDRVAHAGDFELSGDEAYLHYTSNNTIFGTQYHSVPDTGSVPLVCDMSSDILSAPLDVSRFGLIYAGAQKNMGPAGVTTVIIRRDLLERSSPDLPEMFSYAAVEAKNSMLNTPPVYAIYMVNLVTQWLVDNGGLASMAKVNGGKAVALYDAIDGSDGFYRPHSQPNSRSKMNVTFRLPSEELEKTFVAQSAAAGLVGLKGHRSVGGLRASIYNAVPRDSVDALVAFMADFRAEHG